MLQGCERQQAELQKLSMTLIGWSMKLNTLALGILFVARHPGGDVCVRLMTVTPVTPILFFLL